MKETDNSSDQQNESLPVKFCPICGDTMHKEEYLGSQWWFCDDESCGFFEPDA